MIDVIHVKGLFIEALFYIFIGDVKMPMHCPYCGSTQIHRIFVEHSKSNAAHAGLGLTVNWGMSRLMLIFLSRSKSLTIAPWVIGLGEVLLKSLLQYVLESLKHSAGSGLYAEFYCEKCKRCCG